MKIDSYWCSSFPARRDLEKLILTRSFGNNHWLHQWKWLDFSLGRAWQVCLTKSISCLDISSLPLPLVLGKHGSSQADLSALKPALLASLLDTSPQFWYSKDLSLFQSGPSMMLCIVLMMLLPQSFAVMICN